LTEYAIIQNSFDRFAKEASKLAFDIIEVGENLVDLNLEKKRKIHDTIESLDLEIQ
jgi:phosphosulfolactate synthase